MKTLVLALGDKGGPGSGFHGHAGRPGKLGGSASVGSTLPDVESLASAAEAVGKQYFGDALIYKKPVSTERKSASELAYVDPDFTYLLEYDPNTCKGNRAFGFDEDNPLFDEDNPHAAEQYANSWYAKHPADGKLLVSYTAGDKSIIIWTKTSKGDVSYIDKLEAARSAHQGDISRRTSLSSRAMTAIHKSISSANIKAGTRITIDGIMYKLGIDPSIHTDGTVGLLLNDINDKYVGSRSVTPDQLLELAGRKELGDKGGPGSGFHGHAGRQGKIGGSASNPFDRYLAGDSVPLNKADLLNFAIDHMKGMDPAHAVKVIEELQFFGAASKDIDGLEEITTKSPAEFIDNGEAFEHVRKQLGACSGSYWNSYINIHPSSIQAVLCHEIGHYVGDHYGFEDHKKSQLMSMLDELRRTKAYAIEELGLSANATKDIYELFADVYETIKQSVAYIRMGELKEDFLKIQLDKLRKVMAEHSLDDVFDALSI